MGYVLIFLRAFHFSISKCSFPIQGSLSKVNKTKVSVVHRQEIPKYFLSVNSSKFGETVN